MNLDLAALAATVVSSYLVPYVKHGISRIAETITEKVNASVAKKTTELTQTVWDRVQKVFVGDQQNILENFEKYKGAGEDLVIAILREKLEGDPDFAHEINQIINTPVDSEQVGTTGASIMNAHIAGIADLRNANLSNASNITITGVSISDKEQKNEPPGGTE